MNREQWLNTLATKLNPIFQEAGFEVPTNLKVSVGFPSKGLKSKVIGECWDMEQTADKMFHIFIHPSQDDSVRVAGILVHEICHAIVGVKEKHNGVFKDIATRVGLVGKMKATEESPELIKKLSDIIKEIGPYPHSKLNTEGKVKEGPKNQGAIKLVCPKDEYNVRISKKWLERGLPICPCGEELQEEVKEEVGE